MKAKLFSEFVTSMREGGVILRGIVNPKRKLVLKAQQIRKKKRPMVRKFS
jgi:hypothetical protein